MIQVEWARGDKIKGDFNKALQPIKLCDLHSYQARSWADYFVGKLSKLKKIVRMKLQSHKLRMTIWILRMLNRPVQCGVRKGSCKLEGIPTWILYLNIEVGSIRQLHNQPIITIVSVIRNLPGFLFLATLNPFPVGLASKFPPNYALDLSCHPPDHRDWSANNTCR